MTETITRNDLVRKVEALTERQWREDHSIGHKAATERELNEALYDLERWDAENSPLTQAQVHAIGRILADAVAKGVETHEGAVAKFDAALRRMAK